MNDLSVKSDRLTTKTVFLFEPKRPNFSDDFDLDLNVPLPTSIMKYLFEASPHMIGRTNEYLHAVNQIYQVKK